VIPEHLLALTSHGSFHCVQARDEHVVERTIQHHFPSASRKPSASTSDVVLETICQSFLEFPVDFQRFPAILEPETELELASLAGFRLGFCQILAAGIPLLRHSGIPVCARMHQNAPELT
jgi:hypothetical protein